MQQRVDELLAETVPDHELETVPDHIFCTDTVLCCLLCNG